MPVAPSRKSTLEEALALHAAGWWVVPQAGKRAVVLGWDKLRLSEEDLRGYLAEENLNVAVVLSASPWMDVECDSQEAERRLRELCSEEELLTPTWKSQRGKHRLFARPDGLPERAAVTVEGIEFRIGNRPALTTMPPSRNDDGSRRFWLPGLADADVIALPLPVRLRQLLIGGAGGIGKVPAERLGGGAFEEGQRNDELFRYGCRLLRAKLSDGDIGSALAGCNRSQCRPPLPDREVAGVVASVLRLRERQTSGDGMLPCGSWPELILSWREALKWTPGLEHALAVITAAAASVKVVGDQLWVKVISPPSSGKSVLAEALSTNRERVKAVSVFRGFYSGYQADKEGTENFSLLEQIAGKALVVKDGDTILTLPNRQQVLGQGRDLYDTVGRAQYNNRMSKDWEGIRFAWILCGTKSLRALDHSELGQRFLDCRIMDEVDGELEEEIGWRKINQVRSGLYEVDGRADAQEAPEMTAAKRLTGGFLEHLRANMGGLLSGLAMSDAAARKIMAWGQFIAYLRARPSKLQDEEESGREMSARLISQLGKLALCLAVVLGKKEVDADVLGRVKRVVKETSAGRTLAMVRRLAEAGKAGCSAAALSVWTGDGETKERELLRFLGKIGAVMPIKTAGRGTAPRVKWRLTEQLAALCEETL